MEESVTIQEFLTYYRQCMRLEPVDENSYSPLVLAYIGDAVYELMIPGGARCVQAGTQRKISHNSQERVCH